MSDLMLLGVLRMPVDATSTLAVLQYVDRGRQAADRIEADAKEIAALRAQVAALEGDAGRYRWLRMKTAGLRDNEGRSYFSFPSKFGLPPVTDIMRGSVGQHLDAAIDAALAAQKGG